MLNLGLTEPSDGELIRLAPECGIGNTKGIEETDDGVELGSELLKISLSGGRRKVKVGNILRNLSLSILSSV